MNASTAGRVLQKCRLVVLVVDDEQSALDLICALLGKLPGHPEVIAFVDPLRALEWARHHRASLVISDYHMRPINGAAFIREVRRLPSYRTTPIIVVSASEDDTDVARAVQAGSDAWMPKRMMQTVLVSTAQRLLHSKRGAAYRMAGRLRTWISWVWCRLRGRSC